MSLELHIWGPAFGLPSIDPDCLAAIAFLSLSAPREAWSLVVTSPSALPHTLPALRDAQSCRWVAAGFEPIVAYLRDQQATLAGITDLDADLSPIQTADITAYSAFLRAETAPLLSLSLFVSSANWADTTRPAYSHILPFPLTWIEPPAERMVHSARAAHLGFSYLDTDADSDNGSSSSSSPSGFTSLSAAFQRLPDRLRSGKNKDAPAMVTIPLGPSSVISRALTPEARAQIRLDEAARSCLVVLAKRKGSKRLFLRTDTDDGKKTLRPTSLDCLAFGYLALMTVPDVPRPFLRESIRRHACDLIVFVADMRELCFGSSGAKDSALSWQTLPKTYPSPPPAADVVAVVKRKPTSRYLNPLWLRLVHGIVHSIPGLSGEWLVWLWRRIRVDDGSDAIDDDDNDDDNKSSSKQNPWRRDAAAARKQRAITLFATVSGTALAVGLILGYRKLPPFGSPLVVYSRTPNALLGLGAAGAFLSGALY